MLLLPPLPSRPRGAASRTSLLTACLFWTARRVSAHSRRAHPQSTICAHRLPQQTPPQPRSSRTIRTRAPHPQRRHSYDNAARRATRATGHRDRYAPSPTPATASLFPRSRPRNAASHTVAASPSSAPWKPRPTASDTAHPRCPARPVPLSPTPLGVPGTVLVASRSLRGECLPVKHPLEHVIPSATHSLRRPRPRPQSTFWSRRLPPLLPPRLRFGRAPSSHAGAPSLPACSARHPIPPPWTTSHVRFLSRVSSTRRPQRAAEVAALNGASSALGSTRRGPRCPPNAGALHRDAHHATAACMRPLPMLISHHPQLRVYARARLGGRETAV
ncbi:hypothetical protein HYPSUDRAFT_203871 [Hypholoma sublateritium FD-334 SS-4]|uniref:Uncharacterized protein n=1 Tax=Hypholoma sublateritium (strain FD-334 SS-4) TaxID=945553 RepID=A0A0D2MAI2_HYPSF|nr:hypothetical protein HYPSUDRAFT_203871 [Hypholoma sublateritium FD-334 SS-4]